MAPNTMPIAAGISQGARRGILEATPIRDAGQRIERGRVATKTGASAAADVIGVCPLFHFEMVLRAVCAPTAEHISRLSGMLFSKPCYEAPSYRHRRLARPLQAAHPRILRLMKRKYGLELARERLRRIAALPAPAGGVVG